MCEPAIKVVRQGKDEQQWTVETLNDRLYEMREMYDAFKNNQDVFKVGSKKVIIISI